MGLEAQSVSTDLSLALCPDPVDKSSSFTKEFVVDDLNLPFQESSSSQQDIDSAEKTNWCFATLQGEEDHYSQEIHKLCTRMVKHYKATTTCSPSSPPATKNDELENMKTKKRKITKKVDRGEVVVTNEVTDELKRFVKDEMNGVDMKLVIQKKMYATDLNPSQNRLNMPIKQLKTHEFLTPDEKQFLEKDKKNEIEIRLVGPTLQMYMKPMKLKLWHMEHTSNYVFITNWKHFVADNKEELKEGAKIQVWSFRRNQQLCFAIAIVGRPDDNN